MKKIYLIGSLRNPKIPHLGNLLRDTGFEVFDDWFAGGYEADDKWREYEQGRDHTFPEALHGYMAQHIFEFDYHHLITSDIGVLLMPTGKSGHIEAGFLVGKGKPVYALVPNDPDRYDVMYAFFTSVFSTEDELLAELRRQL